jgi:DNA polymerase-3 subunit gamma/tau
VYPNRVPGVRIPPSPPLITPGNMSYQVLALKYRPQKFDEVVGQSHVTTTLTNAISADRMAHAILFTGPRGTGKTTIARILAKAMNCKKGPTTTPCNVCKTCRDIIESHSTDVFEIDGASNNSVDQIRDLRENVTYMPASAPYKIYIIDEVHMLSTAAFNALLKTLEEPPDHVMFIFATTEVHKIPATILSRCQRHDLGRIRLEQIADHLEQIGSKEGYQLDRNSIDLIAQEAEGSIRDSLSLFDRVLSAAGQTSIPHDQVVSILGVLDHQVMHNLCSAVLDKDGASVINIIDSIDNSGLDLKKFYSDIIGHFRNLTIIKQCGTDHPAVNITESEKQNLKDLISRFPAGFLNDTLTLLLREESLIRYSSHTRFAIESVLIKLLDIHPGAHIDRIIKGLDHLSKQMAAPSDPVNVSTGEQKASFGPPPHQGADNRSLKHNSPPPQGIPESGTSVAQSSEPLPKKKTGNTWRTFLKRINQSFPFMVALLSKGQVKEDTDKVIVELDNCSAFDKKRIEDKQPDIVAECKRVLGKTLEIAVLSQNDVLKKETHKKKQAKAIQAAFNHPLVVEAQKLFDGKIINY